MTRMRSRGYVILNSPVASSQYIHNRLTPRNGVDNMPALWCHGANGDYTSTAFSGFIGLSLLGIPLTGGNNGGVQTFGNATAMSGIDTEFTNAQNYFGRNPATDKVVVVGGSMGSVNGLNWIVRNASKVACAVFYLPICDLDDVVANDREGFAAAVLAAHGGTVPADRNPIEFTADYQATGVPTRLYYSDTDTIGLPSFAQAFDSACSNVEAISYGSSGHTNANLPFDTANNWILSQL